MEIDRSTGYGLAHEITDVCGDATNGDGSCIKVHAWAATRGAELKDWPRADRVVRAAAMVALVILLLLVVDSLNFGGRWMFPGRAAIREATNTQGAAEGDYERLRVAAYRLLRVYTCQYLANYHLRQRYAWAGTTLSDTVVRFMGVKEAHLDDVRTAWGSSITVYLYCGAAVYEADSREMIYRDRFANAIDVTLREEAVQLAQSCLDNVEDKDALLVTIEWELAQLADVLNDSAPGWQARQVAPTVLPVSHEDWTYSTLQAVGDDAWLRCERKLDDMPRRASKL